MSSCASACPPEGTEPARCPPVPTSGHSASVPVCGGGRGGGSGVCVGGGGGVCVDVGGEGEEATNSSRMDGLQRANVSTQHTTAHHSTAQHSTA